MKKEIKPLVTIVTTTFNLIKAGREKYFRQCLKSVHNQTYGNIEHVIVDGASKDGTVDLINEYANKKWIKYISEPDKGIYNAMNKSIKLAKGKYITFLNSDDFFHNKDSVRLSVEALEKAQADFSYANYIEINKENKRFVEAHIENFLYTMPFGHPTMFAKTSLLLKEKGFNEDYKMSADYDLIIRLILNDYKGVYLKKEIASYRVGGLGCQTDYSDEIAKIYYNNYSVFQKFSSADEAKKIMYELKLPYGFIANFRKYASEKKYVNIDVNKIIASLLANLTESEKTKASNNLNYKEGIPVFLSSDNNFAPFVATTICSILDHTKSYINFFVLDGGISEFNKGRIEDVKKLFSNFSIEFIEIDTKKEFLNFPTRLHFSVAMYTRFLIPKLKPNLKKVIYSDVDVIFNDDIKYLFDENLEKYSIGAVPCTFAYLNPCKKEIESFHKRLRLSGNHEYFESGLLLINTDLWRRKNVTEKLINKTKSVSSKVILTPDQDVLNMVFENNYKKLSNKYIVVPHRRKVMQTEFKARESIEKPFIFHYAGPNKPWNDPTMELAENFWKYARMTIFYEELIYNLSKNTALRVREEEMEKLKYGRKVAKAELKNKIYFVIFSPKKFIKKYWYKFMNSPLRQPARKAWYGIRGKKLK